MFKSPSRRTPSPGAAGGSAPTDSDTRREKSWCVPATSAHAASQALSGQKKENCPKENEFCKVLR